MMQNTQLKKPIKVKNTTKQKITIVNKRIKLPLKGTFLFLLTYNYNSCTESYLLDVYLISSVANKKVITKKVGQIKLSILLKCAKIKKIGYL